MIIYSRVARSVNQGRRIHPAAFHTQGHHKISPDALAAEFWDYFQQDRWEIPIGKVKWLVRINR